MSLVLLEAASSLMGHGHSLTACPPRLHLFRNDSVQCGAINNTLLLDPSAGPLAPCHSTILSLCARAWLVDRPPGPYANANANGSFYGTGRRVRGAETVKLRVSSYVGKLAAPSLQRMAAGN